MSTLLFEIKLPTGQTLQARQGDLTEEVCDAIVNAANGSLAHGAGVAGVIVRRGGAIIQDESDRWISQNGEVPTGQVAVTVAGALPCKWVIHAVGPVWRGGGASEDGFLASAVENSLRQAEELQLTSIAFPAISSGIFGFPKERCASIMLDAVLSYCAGQPQSRLRQIRFTNIDALTAKIFESALRKLEK